MATLAPTVTGLEVCLEGVTHHYRVGEAKLEALQRIDLDVRGGEFLALIGPSGCGKTTLLRIMAGFLEPTAGAVRIDGAAPGAARRRRLLGWVPQTPALLPWLNVVGNVRLLAPELDNAAVAALLDEVGLAGFQRAYPRHLSVGMQQRVALLRALAPRPRLLLMDEPFSALDTLLREELQGLLRALVRRRGVTAVLVTHSISEAIRLADRIVVLTPRPGRIVTSINVDLDAERAVEAETAPRFQAYVAGVRAALVA